MWQFFLLLFLLKNDKITVTGDFIKETKQGHGEVEVVSGKFYWTTNGLLLFSVLKPVEQIFTFHSDTLILFYPKKNLAFKIKSYNPVFTIPSYAPFMYSGRIDLTQFGFMFVKKKKTLDTLYSYWVPKDRGIIETIVVGEVSNRLISIEIKAKRNQFAKVIYGQFIAYKNFNVPTEIYSIQSFGVDTLIEHYRYQNLQFNVQLPDSIVHFSIPEGCQIKEIMW